MKLSRVLVLIGIVVLPGFLIERIHGQTEIMRWQNGKRAAVSLTYDDGTINQFRIALPIMNRLGFPATFYIITGNIPGSEYEGQFFGRPVEEIIDETARIPTNEDNFFERASAVAFLGFKGTTRFHTQAGQLFESGRVDEAYELLDQTYKQVREGAFEPVVQTSTDQHHNNRITWDEIKSIAEQGHEFGSHTITHPRLAVLDEENMLYELERSREDILHRLGSEHTFSAECPYGTEDERVMEYAIRIYPALRNRMPEPFLEELNRWNDMSPGESDKEYVQWQRGPLTATTMELMKSWVDTLIDHDNVWLVLVFHGVDGIGWEAKPREEFEEYFQYIKDLEDHLWVATFKDVTKYMRERVHAKVEMATKNKKIHIELMHSLDRDMYDLPLTLKTYVPPFWQSARIKQGKDKRILPTNQDQDGTYVMYQAKPNGGLIQLTQSSESQAVKINQNDEGLIRDLVAGYAVARDKQNSEVIAKLFTPDADQLVSSGEWRFGRDNLVTGMLQSSKRNPGDRTIVVERVRFLRPDVAIADARYTIKGADGDQDRNMWSIFLAIKERGDWRLTAIRNMLPAVN